MSVYSQKKVYDSPSYINQQGSHYVLEETMNQRSPQNRNEYVIYLDSHVSRPVAQEVTTKTMEYQQQDVYFDEKLREFERNHQVEIEEIKVRVMNECKIILEKELRSQASSFLIERTSLERIIKDQQTNIVEFQIKIKSFEEELNVLCIKINEKDQYISKINLELSANRQGDEQTIIDLRAHYEEMLKYQEEKFKQDLQDQISNLRISYEATIKSYEKRIESFERRISGLNKTIEALNQTILERSQEIDNLQRSLNETEHRYLLQEGKLRQEYEKTLTLTRREYEERIKVLEQKIQKLEKALIEMQSQLNGIRRLEEEVLEWQRKCSILEKQKSREIIKEVYVDKPMKEREVVHIDSKNERKWFQDKTRLEEEIEAMRIRVRECEFQVQQAEQILYAKDIELQRTYVLIEELQGSVRDINLEIERVKEENFTIMKDREKIVIMVKSYRRYLKELESVVSGRNRELFQRIKELDLVISGEEFVVDVNVMPMISKIHSQNIGHSYNSPQVEKKKNVVTKKTVKVSSSAMKN